MALAITFLGSSGAIPTAERDTMSLAVKSGSFSVLVDCGGSPLMKLTKAGIDPLYLDSVVLTHRHPDHVYGIPALLQGLGLMNRRKPLELYAGEDVLNLVQVLIGVHELEAHIQRIPLRLSSISPEHDALLLQAGSFSIRTAPVEHSVPTLALKFLDADSGKSIVYSSDTSPSENLIAFARGADLLIHEAGLPPGTETGGHSTPRQAGQTARRAEVKQLMLVHLPPSDDHGQRAINEARQEFEGKIRTPAPFETFSL